MNEVRNAYDQWANQYDTNENKTRDIEAFALRTILKDIRPQRTLELGCGTGKNSVWLAEISNELVAVDVSENMLESAKQKLKSPHVQFHVANLLSPWQFTNGLFDLVVCSLMLEHIEDLTSFFQKISSFTRKGAQFYLGELHPFKQYAGSKARFETEEGIHIVPCFIHHLSDFVEAANANQFKLIELKEYFDNDEKNQIPRLLCLVFEKV